MAVVSVARVHAQRSLLLSLFDATMCAERGQKHEGNKGQDLILAERQRRTLGSTSLGLHASFAVSRGHHLLWWRRSRRRKSGSRRWRLRTPRVAGGKRALRGRAGSAGQARQSAAPAAAAPADNCRRRSSRCRRPTCGRRRSCCCTRLRATATASSCWWDFEPFVGLLELRL